MEYIEPVLTVLQKLRTKYNVGVTAVAINWNIYKGAIPVVGTWKQSQAVQNMQALGWRLTREEISDLDKQGFGGSTTMLWQQD